ncbi:ABC transporter multidrug-family permease [Streptococcus thermophilus]|uniref:ABC transporter permease n=1 Tax=Streptococcus thermophilus TaxID=1308 RepID=UPI0015C246FB|nr:ABC transporter permease [Streptococcus thermophilus]CAD0146664.1 ABC transporter multidrug-family permease [Streptococcus thermophilus]CAD0149027.1 ABC transporter multidrug-family permease [Streptococcus thermophilus]
MLNILANERLKLKRNKLLPVCSLLAILIPVFMIIVDLREKDAIAVSMIGIDWLRRLIIPIQIIVYPVLSGFVVTFLVQKEYVEHTMINTLTAPTNRVKFLLGKYLIWTVWFIGITLAFIIVTSLGYSALFGFSEFKSSASEIIELCLKTGILNLLSMSPMLIVCVLQRSTFYPSLLFSCVISGIGMVGLYWPESLRNVIPWSAVTSITLLDTQSTLPYVMIILCYIIGLLASSYCFRKQNL